jgi:hypothetical protein
VSGVGLAWEELARGGSCYSCSHYIHPAVDAIHMRRQPVHTTQNTRSEQSTEHDYTT